MAALLVLFPVLLAVVAALPAVLGVEAVLVVLGAEAAVPLQPLLNRQSFSAEMARNTP